MVSAVQWSCIGPARELLLDGKPGLRSSRQHRAGARASSKCREPTSAMAVNESGLGSSADGKGEEGIDRSFDRAGTPKYLTEYKPSLERGEQSSGEVVRIDVGPEFAV